jgi:hypothetical protein
MKKPSKFEENIKQPVMAGIREGGLLGTFQNEAGVTGERQFSTPFQKGLYQTTKLAVYAAELATLGGLGKGLEKLSTSQKAYTAAKTGGTYKYFFTAANIGKAGSKLNIATKIAATTAPSFLIGGVAYKTGEKLTFTKRTAGLDLKQQSKEFLEREREVARQSGLAAATLSANVVSQASGATYVVADTARKRAALTLAERGKNIFAAGAGEGSTIVYYGQEARGGKTFIGNSENKLFRAVEVVGLGGILGGGSASLIDYGIEGFSRLSTKTKFKPAKVATKGISQGIEGFAYGTDVYEKPGDIIEAGLRGGEAFSTRPVRISTKTDFNFPSFSFTKTKTGTKTTPMVNVRGLTTTKTGTLTTTRTELSTKLSEIVPTRTEVSTRTNVPVSVRTTIPTTTRTDLSIKNNLLTNVRTDTKINTDIGIRTDTRTDIKLDPIDVPVTVATGLQIPPLFGLNPYKGQRQPTLFGRSMKKRYSPSLLGIAKGVRATKTTGLSGIEIRGVIGGVKKEKPLKAFKLGGFKVQPVKSGIGMKFKIIKPNKASIGKRILKAVGI